MAKMKEMLTIILISELVKGKQSLNTEVICLQVSKFVEQQFITSHLIKLTQEMLMAFHSKRDT